MAVDKVKECFKRWNIENKIQEFAVSSATVELAAAALGCKPQRIAKTLSFSINDKTVLIVTAGDARVDNRKFKIQFNTKAKMLSPDEVESKTGHTVGGVCPFGINKDADVYLDVSLKRFDTVFPACGSSNNAIELTVSELEEYSNSISWIDVCKNWQETPL
jgi:prolyl-tRNA editing enzyme YbaK/EbsC (Cys-tRNA(Pro) deacylase)